MNRNRVMVLVSIGAVAIAAVWGISLAVQRSQRAPTTAPTPAVQETEARGAERKITATLFFISEDGMSLQPSQREVPFGEPVAEQARRIVEAQIAAPQAPLASAIPAGTRVRALYVSERGDAFVDLTGEVSARHTGGALDELFTVYAVVNALTVNLPAIKRVQILIDGKEADTLAGHVDLRQPLGKNLKWVKTDNPL